MQTNRSLIKLILLSIITLGIYGLFFWSGYARDMNIVCEGDGKKTRGILARLVFSILTLGIYDFVWLYGAGDRIAANCIRKGVSNDTTGGKVLCWYIFGVLLFGIGPLVGAHKLITGLNDLCAAYNAGNRGHGASVNVNINTGSM